MSIIILGDPHLGAGKNIAKSSVGSQVHSRISDQLDILEWTLNKAIENNSSDIIITGDVFEEPKPEPILIKLFMEWVQKCSISSIKVHVLMGNHDILRNGNSYSSPLDIIAIADIEGVFVYKDINTITVDNTCITLMPFRDKKSLFETSNAEAIKKLEESLVYEKSFIPQIYHKILVGHFALEGSIYVGDEIDDASNELFCPLSMFNGYDCVWMGHVHSPQVLSKSPYISHIGSMDISNFGETEHVKHIVIYDTIDGSFKKENIPSRSLKKISIEIPENVEDATDYVIQHLKNKKFDKSIIKMEITVSPGSIKPVNKTMIESKLKELGAFSISSISETKKQNIITKKENISSMEKALTIPSAINKYASAYVEEDKRQTFIDLSLEIFKSLEKN